MASEDGTPSASLLRDGRSASFAMPRFSPPLFLFAVSLPCVLVIFTTAVGVHDKVFSEAKMQECWKYPGLHWAGDIVHWLSELENSTVICQQVPDQDALFITYFILGPTWLLIVYSAYATRALRRRPGVVLDLTKRVFALAEPQAYDPPALKGEEEEGGHYLGQIPAGEHTQALLKALHKDGEGTIVRHVLFVFCIQLCMFLFDAYVKELTWRWIWFYQLLWLSFSATLLQVRPFVKYCVYLSRTLVDLYIELLRGRHRSWRQLVRWHRELELDVLALWQQVNLHALMPSLPFFCVAIVHFLSDLDVNSGTILATMLLAIGGVVSVLVLVPLARISTMFSSHLAFKAGELRRPGARSIVAVARSFAHEERPATEDQEYSIFLEYVQGAKFCVALGFPGLVMVPIHTETVTDIFYTSIMKLPLLVALFLTLRQKVNEVTAKRHHG